MSVGDSDGVSGMGRERERFVCESVKWCVECRIGDRSVGIVL